MRSRRSITLAISGTLAIAALAAGAAWLVIAHRSEANAEAASVERYAGAAAAYTDASATRNGAVRALETAQRDVLALDAAGTALLEVAQPELLADPATRDAVTAALDALVTASGLPEDASTLPPVAPRAPAWTLYLPALDSPELRDEAASDLTVSIRGVEEESATIAATHKDLTAARKTVTTAMLGLAASAHKKGTASAAPEKASQESKDAYAAAVAALATPPSSDRVLTLVTAYRDTWNAAVASDAANRAAEKARQADSVVPTYIRGILVVNKSYALPSSYGNGLTGETVAAFNSMQAEAASKGLNIYISSGFRSYWTQKAIYDRLVAQGGVAYADRDTARPGHSEHQSGLTIDLNSISQSFAATPEGQWVRDNAHRFGFVIRYPQGKESITGYIWEPWHLRYLGVSVATDLYSSGLTLEEYLGVTSRYP